MLPIAVEIAPPDAQREQVTALLSACSHVIADAECVLAAEAPQGGATAVAIVTWQGEEQAFVEVGMRRNGRPEWRSRNVKFAADDEPIERWRTLGFVVGTLARSELAAEPEPPEPTPTNERSPGSSPQPANVPSSQPPARATRNPPKNHPARAAIDIGAEVGPALESGWRTGALLRTRWPFQDPLRVVVSFKYLQQNDATPDARWFTGGTGLAWVYGNARAEISAAAEARVEYFEAKYSQYYGGASSTSSGRNSRWLAGLGTNATAAWMPMPALGLYVSADAAWMFGYTRIHVTKPGLSEQVITDEPLRFGIGGGVRLRLW
ncbi:MAG: hypothetical protein ACOY0T_04445 [Myxococcota bacterium]